MASWLRRRDVLVGLIGIALVALLALLHPDLETIFVTIALVVVVGLFASALGLSGARRAR